LSSSRAGFIACHPPALRRSFSVIGIALTAEQRRPFGAFAKLRAGLTRAQTAIRDSRIVSVWTETKGLFYPRIPFSIAAEARPRAQRVLVPTPAKYASRSAGAAQPRSAKNHSSHATLGAVPTTFRQPTSDAACAVAVYRNSSGRMLYVNHV
jgi:hypothetical protein